MMVAPKTEYTTCKLSDLGFLGRGKSKHRPRNDPSLYGGPYPFFQTGDVKAAELYLSVYTQTYNEKGLAQSKLWNPGTLLITIAANIAETAILTVKGCFPDSIIGFIPHEDKADARYVKYLIDTLKLQMQNISKGTTQDNLSVEKLLTIPFTVPPLETQREIAGILGAYDDLIENNRRRIAILEEMARNLYKEWFLHFRFPGHENVKLVETEHGMIPEGWEWKEADTLMNRLKAKRVYKQDDVLDEGEVVVIDQSTSEYLGYHNDEPDFEASPDEPFAIFGDHTCKLVMMIEPFSIGPNVVPFTSKKDLPLPFLIESLRSKVSTQEYKRHWSTLKKQLVTVPTGDLPKTFCELTTPMFEQIALMRRRNRNLARTRDLILPRLMEPKGIEEETKS